jgi:hypothetical protein
MDSPPSMLIACPVHQSASVEAKYRTAAAMSSGCPPWPVIVSTARLIHRGNDDTRPLTRQCLADLKPKTSAATRNDGNLF